MRSRILALALVALVVAVSPASAQSELDQARERAEAAAEAADDARDAAAEAQARADGLAEDLEEAVHEAEDLDTRIVVVEGRATAAQAERDTLYGDVEDLLVLQYVFVERVQGELVSDVSRDEQVRAAALARYVTFGVGTDIDRYRIVLDDLIAAEEELLGLGEELDDAIGELEERNELLYAELEEINRQLEIADEREIEYEREVVRLEEEERKRLEEERRRREEKRRAELAARRAAEEEARRAAAATSTTTTTTTTTTSTTTTQPADTPTSDASDPGGGTAQSTSPETTDAAVTEPTQPEPTGFLCPIGGPTTFYDTYGAARSGGRRHKGVDMFAPRGTPVVASVSGTVRHRDNSLGGKSYYLDGDDGNRYYGAHLDSYGASGYVAAGTVVGTVGNTGNARYTSPHLHFEVMPGGSGSVNPTPIVRAACG